MKKGLVSKIAASILSLSLVAVGFAGMPAAKASAASQPVQLKNAYYYDNLGYDLPEYFTSGEIDVQKLGTDKQVTVHYTVDGTSWYDLSAAYVKDDPNNSGYEIWSFDFSKDGLYTFVNKIKSFAIKYVVDGTTYWDNNNGSNYSFTNWSTSAILGKDAVKYFTTGADRSAGSSIYVQNLAYNKTVGVRYTTDNWATSTDVDATFARSQDSNVDVFNLPTIPAGAQFIVYYTVNGTTYLDNNDGANYTK